MSVQNALKFDSIFEIFRSKGAGEAIKKAGAEPSASSDPRLCGLLAFCYYARTEEGNNYLEIGNRWFEHGKSLQTTVDALMLSAEYYKKLNVENVPKDEIGFLLDEARQLDPKNPLVLQLYIEHDYADGDEQGIQLLRALTEDWPDYASAWFLLGQYSLTKGDYQPSIDAFKQVVALRPEFTAAWNMLGIVYSRYATGAMERSRMEYAARQQLRVFEGEGVATEENDEELNQAKEFHQNLLKSSKEAYNRALQLEPNSAYTLVASGLVEHELGDSEKAYTLIQKGLALDPKLRSTSDFENILEELRQEISEADMSDVERDLVRRAQGYQIHSKQSYKAQDKKFQPWHDNVHEHFTEHLFPEIRSRKEIFVEYWPAYLFWGVGENISSGVSGRVYRNKLGNYGSGYLCLTNSAIYASVIESISRDFAAIPSGLTYKFWDTAAGNRDKRNLYEETATWRITFEEILGSQIGTDDDGQKVIILRTSSGQDWNIGDFLRGTLEEMQAAIAMGKSGKFSKYFSKGVDKTEEILSKLVALKDAGVLSEQEFEEKRRGILKGL